MPGTGVQGVRRGPMLWAAQQGPGSWWPAGPEAGAESPVGFI